MAVAKNEVTNQALCEMFPLLVTSDEWVTKNVGVEKRYLAGDDECLVDLLEKAALEAIAQSGVEKIDRIIVGSNTQPNSFPATASELAQRLKARVDLSSCWCLDVQNGCPAGLVAISLGVDAVRTGQAETVLAVGGDLTSRMVNWFDRNTCLLLGDAASAFVLTSPEHSGRGEISVAIRSYWSQTDYESAGIMARESGLSNFSPFYISNRTRGAASEAVSRIKSQEKATADTAKEVDQKFFEAACALQAEIFPPRGNYPYKENYWPFFTMEGAEVLEKIRRTVADCGYLPALRRADLGLEIMKEAEIVNLNKVSQIPSRIRKSVMRQLAETYDLLIPHQANMRGHQNLAAALQVPMNKVYSNIAHYANTSAAAAGIALYEALRQPARYRTIRGDLAEIEVPIFKPSQKAVLVSFGSGTNVVFIVVERLK